MGINEKEWVIALAGNPNVGKSTVFNRLTGMHQHTGNWPGKTVSNARGKCVFQGESYILMDLPGTYSLLAHSAEEEAARDFLCFGQPDACVVVCDATCLERNLNLVLQVRELIPRTVVCLNLMDEAKRKGITIHVKKLEKSLGLPVVPVSARSGKGLERLLETIAERCGKPAGEPIAAPYREEMKRAAAVIEPVLRDKGVPVPKWAAMRLLEGDIALHEAMDKIWHVNGIPLERALYFAEQELKKAEISQETLVDETVSALTVEAEKIAASAKEGGRNSRWDRRLDKILTGKWTGIPVMLLLLAGVFWITIVGANIPSQWLGDGLFFLGEKMGEGLLWLGAPVWLEELLIMGVWRVLAWVVSVMLPPMAIFFPLFTLLEDLGYLPRVAFTLDHCFQKARACGKQALTMCMGFGCNAAGVTGCRIIDSPRERLIAVMTNSFVPCNGRFPAMIALITVFFAGSAGAFSSALSAIMVTAVVLLGIVMTFLVSRLLSATLLRGTPSSFTLELPPYRRPQVGQVLVRSVLDRTLFVLGRAVTVAAPAGLVIWLMANLKVGGETLLMLCAGFLEPLGQFLGMDGVILLAFILGFPANEIVVPIIAMAYLAQGYILELDVPALGQLLQANGWTWLTALCTILFSLMHWPCSTTCLTIRKETGSWKWTAAAFFLPTLCGMAICAAVAAIARGLGWA